jgi:NAD(P)-dependent dehydrogenase (short-subunit alcohol dehydrogenase family)
VTTGRLDGRLAVVTGGSKGIGAAVAAALRAEGAEVVRAARQPGPTLPGEHSVAVDLSADDGPAELARRVLAIGVPDLVVAGAGAFVLAPFQETAVTELDRLYRINLRAPFELARLLIPEMQRRGRGRHITIGSVADHRAFPGNAAYAATKFGLRGWHEVLEEECRGSGVLCSLVSPGPVDTEMWDPVDPDHRTDLPSRSAMLLPADVAEAVLWIATRPARVGVGVLQLGPA